MFKQILPCAAQIMSPVALGVMENVKKIEPVITTLKEHIEGNELLARALSDSFGKALDTLKITLSGPKFYQQSAIEDFAINFHTQVLPPFLAKNKMDKDEFVLHCLSDFESLKGQNFFAVDVAALSEIVEMLALYARQDIVAIDEMENDGRHVLAEAVRQVTTVPYAFASLLAQKNILASAASLHFSLAVQPDIYLFQAYLLGHHYQLKQQMDSVVQQGSEVKPKKLQLTVKIARSEVQVKLEKNLEQVKDSSEIRSFLWHNKGNWQEKEWNVWTDHLQAKGYYPLEEGMLKKAVEEEMASYPEYISSVEAQKSMIHTMEKGCQYADALRLLQELEDGGLWDETLQQWKDSLADKERLLRENREEGLRLWRAKDLGGAMICLQKAYELNPADREIADIIGKVAQGKTGKTTSTGAAKNIASKKIGATMKLVRSELQMRLERNMERLKESNEIRNFVWRTQAKWSKSDWDVWTQGLQEEGYYPLDEESLEYVLAQECKLFPELQAEVESQKIMIATLEKNGQLSEALSFLWQLQGQGFWDDDFAKWEGNLREKERSLQKSRSEGLRLWREMSDPYDALAYLQIAHDLDPGDEEVAQALRLAEARITREVNQEVTARNQQECQTYLKQGDSDLAAGHVEKALKCYDQAIQILPTDKVARRKKQEALELKARLEREYREAMRQASEAETRSDLVAARQFYLTALLLQPGDEAAQVGLACLPAKIKEQLYDQSPWFDDLVKHYDFPAALLEQVVYLCEGKAIFDMTGQAWQEFSSTQRNKFAAAYQATYAKMAKLESETIVQVGSERFTMVLIPPGRFWMGSPLTEEERGKDEKRHRAIVSKAFYIAKHAVTQGQWKAVTGKNPAHFKLLFSAKSDTLPVEQISWQDALIFCHKTALSLPSEVQWEYACRAGTLTPFNQGDNITTERVNYDGNYPYGKGSKGQYRQRTVPVGSLPNANAWGCFDCHGNIWEWCLDSYGGYPKDDIVDFVYPLTTSSRVVRGGSWYSYAWLCRSAIRSELSPEHSSDAVGVRLVKSL
jgi:formylglycine-generating enzyme required for sulfatase activity